MAQKQNLSELTTEELASRLVKLKFLLDYFNRGKDPDFWVRALAEVEQELARRRALS